ncbi:hypothetical protein VNO78_31010 [Psophocarpus tetragonolobus]|uniref:Uncharacterized protein n=1 Tax=Psophocarpus tetragonolobus TaxID=3891 RepID=A0AAN9RY64_PSOTE
MHFAVNHKAIFTIISFWEITESLFSHSQRFHFLSLSLFLCAHSLIKKPCGRHQTEHKLKDFFKVVCFIPGRSKASSRSLSRSADFQRPGRRRLQDVVWWTLCSVVLVFFIYFLTKGTTKIDSTHQFSRV